MSSFGPSWSAGEKDGMTSSMKLWLLVNGEKTFSCPDKPRSAKVLKINKKSHQGNQGVCV